MVEIHNNKKMLTGTVLSDKMDKTVTVRVDRTVRHATYLKTMSVSKKYKVHDENGVAKVGDIIEFYVCRPLSKTKHMMLHRVIKSNTSNVSE
jgi:small subunit ribosomal protein S17